MNNVTSGKIGEAKALKFVVNNKYTILAINYRNKIGEIDIIATKGGVLCFIEVKTRNSKFFGTGRQSVTKEKQSKIKLVAKSFMQKNDLLDAPCRFDVIEVYMDEIEHIENAFC